MKKLRYIWLLVLAMTFVTCEEEEPTTMVATLEIKDVTVDASYREAAIRSSVVTNATIQQIVMEYALDSTFKELKQAQMTKVGSAGETPVYETRMEELEENRTYFIRCRVVNKFSSLASATQSFRTKAFHLPEVRTDSIADVTVSSATLWGTLLDRGSDTPPQVGFCFGDHPNVSMETDEFVIVPPMENVDSIPFAVTLMQLEDNKTYYVRAFAQNMKGVSYGAEISFGTTEILTPTLGGVNVPSLSVTYTSAVVSSEVLADGGSPVFERGVCYSTQPNPTVESTKVSSGSGLGAFACTLNDLIDGKTYYVRAYAMNIKGTSYSEEVAFSTVEYGKPTVITSEVTAIDYTSAKVKAEVKADGGQTVMERGICFATTENPTIENNDKIVSVGTIGSYTCSMESLEAGTTYYVRAYATNSKGTAYGEELTFATHAYGKPTVGTGDVTDITYTSATCSGNVLADGGKTITERGICFATHSEPTLEDHKMTSSGKLGTFNCYLKDLADGTTYYVRAYATNSEGTAYGNEVIFATYAYGLPTVTTSAASAISYEAATVGGNVTADGDLSITERGVCYSTTSNPTIENSKVISTGELGAFTCKLTELTDGTTYYFRAYAKNAKGTGYGAERQFTTLKYALPTVTTSSATNVSFNTATCGGTVTADGGAEVIERGVCYSTWRDNPSLDNEDDVKVVSGKGKGAFTCDLSDLTSGITYHVRAYATNSLGTSYGKAVTFTTLAYGMATVTTTSAKNVTAHTATVGGNVTDDGGDATTVRGVCYATHSEPTIEDSKVENGTGKGTYSCELSELEDGTTYYFRAYATNSKGTSYGNERSFTTTALYVPTLYIDHGAYNVTYTSAKPYAVLSSTGGLEITEIGFCYSSKNTEPTTADMTVKYEGTVSAGSSYNCEITGLKGGTTYYYRAYAINEKGVGYSEVNSFETMDYTVPTVQVDTVAYDITYTSAKCNGKVTNTGGLDILEYGVCYSSEKTEPTIEDPHVAGIGEATSSFLCQMEGLQEGTTYYYRIYAKNEKGVGYISSYDYYYGTLHFTTLSYNAPTVSTKSYSDLTHTSVIVGGEVTASPDLEVTERGICVSRTNYTPTLEDSVIICGDGLGAFTHQLTDLQDGVTYRYRAYAKNAKGVGYGSRETFTTPAYSLPSVTTKSSSDVTYTTATVGGEVTSGDGLTILERGIVISKDNTYPEVDKDSLIPCGEGLGSFSVTLTDLADGTYYNYRAYAKTPKGVGYGDLYSFKTSKFEVPSVSTKSYSNVTFTSATVGGEVTDEKGHPVREYGIVISKEDKYPEAGVDSTIVCGKGLGEFTHELTNLEDGQRYYYRAYAKSDYGVGYGGRDYFTTNSYSNPSVSTTYYSNVEYTTATVGGEVTAGGGLDVLEYGIVISTTHDYPEIDKDSVIKCGSGLGKFTLELTNLKDGQHYNYRAYAKTAKRVGYGDREYFTTKKFEVPNVSTTYYSNVGNTTATVGGTINDEKGHPVTERGIVISRTNDYPTYEADSVIKCGSGLGSFTHDLTNLIDGQRYYYRAFGKSEYGVGYGGREYFSTNSYPRPSVNTYNVSEISYYSAKLNGWASNVSEHPNTERGFCYATTENPTIKDTKVIASLTSSYDYNVEANGLDAGTTYYVRAYAINEYGPKYGDNQSFTTLPYSVPTVTTNDPTVVTFESAMCTGKVTAYGGKEVTAYGICYSTSPNPTIYDNYVNGLGKEESFQCPLMSLTDNTTYYYRAFATNAEGTGYGEEKSFTTVDYNAAVIYYTAPNKLNEATYGPGLHPNAFNVEFSSHTFENGVGTIRFADKVTRVNSWAFERCTGMTSVTLPYSIEEINDNPFIGCTGLTSIDIPENVRSLTPRKAFDECYNLVSINVHPSNQYFCDVDGVLFSKDKQTLLFYPVGKTATSYSIQSGVKYIEDKAFYKCTSLTSVTLPQTLTEIKYEAFRESGLTSITIPNSVTRLHGYTFYGCTSLTTVDIGYGVTNISGSDFNQCPNITSVTCRAYNPPSGCGNFDAIDKTVVPLYVPNGFVDLYKNTDCWKDFTNILPIP